MSETTGASTWSLGGLKDSLLGGNKGKASEETQASVNAALREETKLKEERGESTSGWRSKIKAMMDDDDNLKEEIKKLEAELAEIRADQANDTWTEKASIIWLLNAGGRGARPAYSCFGLVQPRTSDQRERPLGIAAKFDGSREAQQAKILELETKIAELKKQEAEKQEGWKGKLQDVFDGEDDEGKERLKQEVNKESSWRDKLGDQFFGAPQEPKKEEGFSLSGKVGESFSVRVDDNHGLLILDFVQLNELAGGGKKSEANEDKLDKVIDLYQEHVLKQGPQTNESAFEQAKDEQISDAIRSGFKMMTGKDVPVKDKEH